MSALLWFAKLPAPVRGLLALAAAFLLGWGALAVHDRQQRAIGAERERAAQAERARDAALSKADRMWSGVEQLGRQVRVRVVQAARDSAGYAAVRDSVARREPPHSDSGFVAAIQQDARALDSADKALASCSLARLTCQQRSDSLERLVRFLRDSVPAVPAPVLHRSRLSAGCVAGAGATFDPADRRVHAGPTVGCGVSVHF